MFWDRHDQPRYILDALVDLKAASCCCHRVFVRVLVGLNPHLFRDKSRQS
jgi:hypothetical protein